MKVHGNILDSKNFSLEKRIEIIKLIEDSDLLHMDSIELLTIIKQGNLPSEFIELINTDCDSFERIIELNKLKENHNIRNEKLNNDEQIDNSINIVIEPIDDVDETITKLNADDTTTLLPNLNNNINNLKQLDNPLYASMDEDAFELLIQYKIRKLWNDVLNNKIDVLNIENNNGGKYFTIIKQTFLDEYYSIINYTPPTGYNFKYQPNLMQKLTVNRLLKNKFYGNWSGTGAGKTLSFIIASREINSKLTIIVALNSTIQQISDSIKDTYIDSVIYTEYSKDFKFDTNKFNYLILNYEKFQQEYSEHLFQNLTKVNKVDFIVIDEVHNAKQREEDNESIRRGVLLRLIGRSREFNKNLHVLMMSATPVINNLFEAKSLLQLMTGLDYEELNDRRTLQNALEIFKHLTLNGLRFIPNYMINEIELTGNELSNLNINGNHLLEDLLQIQSSRFFDIESLLLTSKLNAIKQYLKKGVIIYSYFTDGIISEIKKFVEKQGFSVGIYCGETNLIYRDIVLKNFIDGSIDILIGSKPIGTGVDGLQKVCDRMIIITLPWTDSEYTQLKGRIYRQGSKFNNVEIIIPQVKIELDNSEIWSWDVQRLNMIKNKRTLADACVDGLIPSKILPKPETMFKKAQESLSNWKERISQGNIIENDRKKTIIDLYPDVINEDEIKTRIDSEINEVHRVANVSYSSKTHKDFTNNPESFFRYHQLRNQRMEKWEEIPYEYIATKIKNKNHIVADFGCGENKFKDCIPHNKVYSFDHVAFDDTVVACDMKNTQLENESIDDAVFSLSLWGINYEDYIKEAYRILNYGGTIYISEPSNKYTTEEKENLKSLLIKNNFKIIGDIEIRGKFFYLRGFKE